MRRILAILVLADVCLPVLADNLENAAAESQRFADCLLADDKRCMRELTHPLVRYQDMTVVDRMAPLGRMSGLFNASRQLSENPMYWSLELSPPEPFEVDDELEYALVPYRVSGYLRAWYERSGFLLGVSGDGRKWCFVEDLALRSRGLKRIVPDYNGAELPEIVDTQVNEPGRMRSAYLDTQSANFVLGEHEGTGYYELDFAVRKKAAKKLVSEILLKFIFENPQDADEPVVVNAILAAGEAEFAIRSPLIEGLRSRETYDVTIIGTDAETREEVISHYQPMYYFPDDSDKAVIPAVAEARYDPHRGNGWRNDTYVRWFDVDDPDDPCTDDSGAWYQRPLPHR